jgi:hypothetical protein
MQTRPEKKTKGKFPTSSRFGRKTNLRRDPSKSQLPTSTVLQFCENTGIKKQGTPGRDPARGSPPQFWTKRTRSDSGRAGLQLASAFRSQFWAKPAYRDSGRARLQLAGAFRSQFWAKRAYRDSGRARLQLVSAFRPQLWAKRTRRDSGRAGLQLAGAFRSQFWAKPARKYRGRTRKPDRFRPFLKGTAHGSLPSAPGRAPPIGACIHVFLIPAVRAWAGAARRVFVQVCPIYDERHLFPIASLPSVSSRACARAPADRQFPSRPRVSRCRAACACGQSPVSCFLARGFGLALARGLSRSRWHSSCGCAPPNFPLRSRRGCVCCRISCQLPPAATRARGGTAHSGRRSGNRRPPFAALNALQDAPFRFQSRERSGPQARESERFERPRAREVLSCWTIESLRIDRSLWPSFWRTPALRSRL